MRQLIILVIAITALLSGCNTTNKTESKESISSSKSNEELKLSNEEPATKSSKEEIEIPVERTTEIDNPPFQQYSIAKIKELQSNRETVYLFDDFDNLAEVIEDTVNDEYIANIEDAEITEEETTSMQEGALKDLSQYLKLYIKEIETYTDNEDFLDTLEELSYALEDNDKKTILDLLSKAKEIKH